MSARLEAPARPPVEFSKVRCPCCGNFIPEIDVRPDPPRWGELVDLVEGARKRGFTPEQLEYLRACLGVCWAKAFKRGEVGFEGHTGGPETRR